MKTSEFLEILNRIAPLDLQEEWDNSGMQIDLGRDEVTKVIVGLDINSEIIEEAITKKADMIVTHHPILFDPIKTLGPDDVVGGFVIRLVRAGISVYSSHTCFDAAPYGNNEYLLKKLGVQQMFRLPIPGHHISEAMVARIGSYQQPVFFSEFCEKLSKVLGQPGGIKVSGAPEKLIQRVAVCTGSGGEFWEAAKIAGADVFVTSEVKHHQALAARECGLCLVDAGHYGTENLFVRNMAKQLRKMCDESVEIIETSADQDPFDRIL